MSHKGTILSIPSGQTGLMSEPSRLRPGDLRLFSYNIPAASWNRKFCTACGHWWQADADSVHYVGSSRCFMYCAHCLMFEEDHINGKCLFSPTIFVLMEYRLKVEP